MMLTNNGIRVDAQGSTNGLLYQGVTVEQCCVQEGDLLRIDDGICNVREGVLILVQSVEGGGNWQQISLRGKQRFLLGRAKECDLTFSHVGVSRQHAYLEWRGEQVVLTDLNSANGTFVNGQRVRGKVVLQEKDLISITNNRLIYAAGFL